MSKEYTNDEVRAKFLNHVNHLVQYWANLEGQTDFQKVEGVAFSILSTIDGWSLVRFIKTETKNVTTFPS